VSDFILHVTSRASWSAARNAGAYTADSLESQGFIHCSNTVQVVRVANAIFKGQHGLVLLKIDPSRLTSELRYEPGTDAPDQLFPHIYGPLDLEAVTAVLDFEPGPDGTFSLPAELR
jgi:uncharacterized protein (DUF952 family)